MIEVFSNARKFQEKQVKSSYVAVVVLDEVGLAEDSPNLPLKALHPLLEDGTEGASSNRHDHDLFSDKVKYALGMLLINSETIRPHYDETTLRPLHHVPTAPIKAMCSWLIRKLVSLL